MRIKRATMKPIFLGIKDYVKDCWHDYVLIPRWRREERTEDGWVLGKYVSWKEGSIWHYIRQRRIAKRNEK